MNLVMTWLMSPRHLWSDFFMIINACDWKYLKFWCLKPSGFLGHLAYFISSCMWHCYWPLLPWNVSLLAFRIPASHTFLPLLVPKFWAFSAGSCPPLVLEGWCPPRTDLHSQLFSLRATLKPPNFCPHPIYVLSPHFHILSRAVLFNIVAASHMWLFQLKILW